MSIPEEQKVIETISMFEGKIAHAKHNGDEWVETSPQVITYFNRRGLGASEYFIYKDIKVCEHGKRDAIIDKESMSMDERLHGPNEGKIEGL